MTRIEKRHDGYWLTELPMGTPDIGPYERVSGGNEETNAKLALVGLERFFTVDYWEGWKPTPVKKKVFVKRKNLVDG